jgi:hypothetical protein
MCANFIRFGRDLSGDNVNCSRKKGDSPFCTFLTVRRIMNLIKVLYAIYQNVYNEAENQNVYNEAENQNVYNEAENQNVYSEAENQNVYNDAV